jgi:hypothetical protein
MKVLILLVVIYCYKCTANRGDYEEDKYERKFPLINVIMEEQEKPQCDTTGEEITRRIESDRSMALEETREDDDKYFNTMLSVNKGLDGRLKSISKDFEILLDDIKAKNKRYDGIPKVTMPGVSAQAVQSNTPPLNSGMGGILTNNNALRFKQNKIDQNGPITNINKFFNNFT